MHFRGASLYNKTGLEMKMLAADRSNAIYIYIERIWTLEFEELQRLWLSPRRKSTDVPDCRTNFLGPIFLHGKYENLSAPRKVVKLWGTVTARSPAQARKRHINISFLVWLRLGRPRVCPRDKSPGFLLFCTVETQFVPRTNCVCPWTHWGRRVADKV